MTDLTGASNCGVFVGLGANLGDRANNMARALDRLAADANINVKRVSGFFRTAPWQVDDQQPEYLNAVAEIETWLTPAALVERLLAIERELGRERANGPRWAARSIDLDLLLYGDCIVDDPGCRVPHPRLHERAFALRPLLEIAAHVVIPGIGPAAECLRRLDANPIASVEVAIA